MLAGIAGCTSGTGIQVIEHNIVVSEYTTDAAQSVAVVKGVARNTGAWPLEDCGVSVTFYDFEGNKLDVYSSSCKRLEPGEDWNFSVELKGQEAWQVGKYSISTFSK
ncbi:MAG: FxLYD domain-containing protein [Chloroflexi bacterium]|nr:FxLYD domain-containing protein [Chloroflexota bacterium]